MELIKQSSPERDGGVASTPADALSLPKVTVLVAAWNEADNISSFVRSYLDLTYPKKELILCAGGDDGTYQMAAKHAGDSIMVVQQQPAEGKQRALRKAYEHATGEVIVLTDADCLMNQDALRLLLEPILRGEVQVTTGHTRPKRSQLSDPFAFYQDAMYRRWEPVFQQRSRTQTLDGRNVAVTRAVLESVGAFDEEVYTGTDSFLAKKINVQGYQIFMVADSVVETDYPTSVSSYCRQRSRWRRNAIIHNLRFRFYRRLAGALVPPARGLALLSLPMASLWLGKPVIYAWGLLFAYSFAVRAKYVHRLHQSISNTPRSVYWRIPMYILTEWAAEVLGLIQMVSPRARKRW